MQTITKKYSLNDISIVAQDIINNYLNSKKVIAFFGNMGAGKTTLIKNICTQLGTKNNISSPTFSLVNEYYLPDNNKIFHFDFYRIKNINEVFDMGYEDYFYSNKICFIEWAEKVEDILPPDALKINITVLNELERVITISFE